MNKIEIGFFEIITGKVIVSDPCYTLGTWCQGVLNKVKCGKWIGYVQRSDEGRWGERVAELIACHHESELSLFSCNWTEETFEVGVDSGQAGIFDAKHYRDDSVALEVSRISKEVICPDEPWYSICCDWTIGAESGAGVIPFGIVSSSGFGDGGYRCYIQEDDEGYVTGIRIIFISDEEEEE